MNTIEQLNEAAAFVEARLPGSFRVGIILGTGLNHLVQHVENKIEIPYHEIPHFPASTVSFHKGQFVGGTIGGRQVLIMQGRFHYYEGFSLHQVTLPVRLMKRLGVENLLISNAAGGINPNFKKGDLIVVDDHINLMPDNPLRGLGDEWGERFVDLSQPYDSRLLQIMRQAFVQNKFEFKRGVYAAVMGPNLETKAEYRWLRNTGADMVGMSTVPEVIVANQVGISCCAVSVVTDECDPDNLKPINIAEIISIAGKADIKLSTIFADAVAQL